MPKKEFKKENWQEFILANLEKYTAINKEAAIQRELIKTRYVGKKEELELVQKLGLEDNAVILLLAAFKDLLNEIGFKSISYQPTGPSTANYTGLICSIEWADGTTTSGVGDAHENNCYSFTKFYTGPIAENRSFIRAVKSYFGIMNLGKDEIGPAVEEKPKKTTAHPTPEILLKQNVEKILKISDFSEFAEVVNGGLLDGDDYEEFQKATSFDTISKRLCIKLMAKVVEHSNK